MENIDKVLKIIFDHSNIPLDSIIKKMDQLEHIAPVESKAIINNLIKEGLVDTKSIFDGKMTIFSPSLRAINIMRDYGTYSQYLKVEKMVNNSLNDISNKILKFLYDQERNKPHILNELLRKEAAGKTLDEIRVYLVALMNKQYIKRHQSFISINSSHNIDNYQILAMIDDEGVKYVDEIKRKSLIKKTDKEIILAVLNQMTEDGQYSAETLFKEAGVDDDVRQEYIKNKMIEKNLIKVSSWSNQQILITYEGRILDSDSYDELFRKILDEKNNYIKKEDIELINKKIDDVIEWLKKGDLGNEIIYEELQEMKEKGKILDPKNWKQLLLGKLLALAGDEGTRLGKNLVKDIYEKVTDGDYTNLLNG